MSDYIALADCENGFLYKINSRNLAYGVFQAKEQGFIGVREKFGDRYLFTEYHWDTGAPCGTVRPLIKLEKLPDDIEVAETIEWTDEVTGRPIYFEKSVLDGGKGWCFKDTGETDKSISPQGKDNQKLFDWLEKRKK